MLSTLIYRSRASHLQNLDAMSGLLELARQRNTAMHVTGILLFDGVHFVQLLEGPDAAVDALFESIGRDSRHGNVVRLMRDHAAARRFEGDSMALIDLRELDPGQVSSRLLAQMKTKGPLSGSDDRVINILTWYALARGTRHVVDGEDASNWRFVRGGPPADQAASGVQGQRYQFALQPIVKPMHREVSSFEFLIRGPHGGPPEELFSSIAPGELHRIDLESKALAFRLAGRLPLKDTKIAVNLLPRSLMAEPQAVEFLADQIAAAGLSSQQVIVEVTEQEAVSSPSTFSGVIERLRRAGIGVAIDDFGAGFAGLSLLAEFQPDKLKIDRKLIQDIHLDGPRQAIVVAIVEACAAMGITPVAEGVERVEEWCWLQAAGIQRFQGYLFAKPALNGMPEISWPERV
ncbi:MAG: diguanylate phosphodiesterase [Achromobacter sp.]|uniref:diguanylate phosphodiesterase n=1 Tax=Achromobacter TaxID=222 RepID=UPI0012CB6F90|nr:diguanylate phosphodiesterase [Achromobacter pulmonis]MCF7769195.1 diguanylate phosphodiesterase [Achromobacter pulmonis]MPT25713.1 diguanylate phosphodiesterase [Achromobacter sp.]